MASIAMGAGLPPAASGPRGDAGFRPPLGIAVMGGPAASAVPSLAVAQANCSAVASLLDRWQGRASAKLSAQHPGEASG